MQALRPQGEVAAILLKRDETSAFKCSGYRRGLRTSRDIQHHITRIAMGAHEIPHQLDGLLAVLNPGRI